MASTEHKGLVNTWMLYRAFQYNETHQATIDFVNTALQKKYTISSFSRFITGSRAAPDDVLKLIHCDYPALLTWIAKKSASIDLSERQALILTENLILPFKK
jgi:hypothetical protein